MAPKRPSNGGGYAKLAAAEADVDNTEEQHLEQASLLVQRDLEGEVGYGGAAAPPSATKAGPRRPPPSVWSEVRPMIKLGWPMIISQYLDRSSQQLCVMLIGHIGPEELGSVVLATMWCECATANASHPDFP